MPWLEGGTPAGWAVGYRAHGVAVAVRDDVKEAEVGGFAEGGGGGVKALLVGVVGRLRALLGPFGLLFLDSCGEVRFPGFLTVGEILFCGGCFPL